MPRTRRRKTPIVSNTAAVSSSKPQSSRAVIRQFHVLLKRRHHLSKIGSRNARQVEETLQDVDSQLEALGGLECYQCMSAVGQGDDRGGGSEKILIGWLKDLEMNDLSTRRVIVPDYSDLAPNDTLPESQKLRLLEVGAVKPDNYKSCATWIVSTPIDLRSRHPSIREQDFLIMDEQENFERWNIVSLSLVLNFVPDAKDRGRMLWLAHQILMQDGFLFLALPLPCLSNSRYLTFEHLKNLMMSIGFEQVFSKWKEKGKMVYFLYCKCTALDATESTEKFSKKKVLCQGNRNNFSILLSQELFLKSNKLSSYPS